MKRVREAMELSKRQGGDRFEEFRKWCKVPILVDAPPPLVVPGCQSQEKHNEIMRQSSTLQEIYFTREMIPDSPPEPDLEIVVQKEPQVIPLDEDNLISSVNDYSNSQPITPLLPEILSSLMKINASQTPPLVTPNVEPMQIPIDMEPIPQPHLNLDLINQQNIPMPHNQPGLEPLLGNPNSLLGHAVPPYHSSPDTHEPDIPGAREWQRPLDVPPNEFYGGFPMNKPMPPNQHPPAMNGASRGMRFSRMSNEERKQNNSNVQSPKMKRSNPIKLIDSFTKTTALNNSQVSSHISSSAISSVNLQMKPRPYFSGRFKVPNKLPSESSSAIAVSRNTNVSIVAAKDPAASKVEKLNVEKPPKKSSSKVSYILKNHIMQDVIESKESKTSNDEHHSSKSTSISAFSENKETKKPKRKKKCFKNLCNEIMKVTVEIGKSGPIRTVYRNPDLLKKSTNTNSAKDNRYVSEVPNNLMQSGNYVKLNSVNDDPSSKRMSIKRKYNKTGKNAKKQKVEQEKLKNGLIVSLEVIDKVKHAPPKECSPKRRRIQQKEKSMECNTRVDESDSPSIVSLEVIDKVKHAPPKKCSPKRRKIQQKEKSRECNTRVDESDSSSASSISYTAYKKNSQGKKRKVSFSVNDKKEINKKNNSISPKWLNNLKNKKRLSCSKNAFEEPSSSNSTCHLNHSKLEVSETTLNAIPDDSDTKVFYSSSREMNRMNVKNVTTNNSNNEKNEIALTYLFNALPDESGFLIKISTSSCDSYRCPKCNRRDFKKTKSGLNHYVSCKSSRSKKTAKVSLNKVVLLCTACPFYCNRLSELASHKKCCTPTKKDNKGMSNCILDYKNTSEKYVCPKCSYSCLSYHTYRQHPCGEMLEHMKTCTVAIKKLTESDLNSLDNLSKFECGSCKAVFFDDHTFDKHAELHLSDGVIAAKISINKGQTQARKEIKNIVKNSEQFKSVEDLMEHLVEPIAKINSTVDPGNLTPDLNLNVTLPYEQQKLLGDAATQSFLEMKDGLDCSTKSTNLFKIPSVCEEEDTSDEGNIDARTSHLLALLKNFKCHCKDKKSDFNKEEKPCVSCLNAFMKKHVLSESTLESPFKISHSEMQAVDPVPDNTYKQVQSNCSTTDTSNIHPLDNNQSNNDGVCPDDTSTMYQQTLVNTKSVSSEQVTSMQTEIEPGSENNQTFIENLATSLQSTSIIENTKSSDSVEQSSNDQCTESLDLLICNFNQVNESEPSTPKSVNFEQILKTYVEHEHSVDVEFSIDSVNVSIHCNFDPNVAYSCHILRGGTQKYICASCLTEYPPSELLQHLVHKHKETNIDILVS